MLGEAELQGSLVPAKLQRRHAVGGVAGEVVVGLLGEAHAYWWAWTLQVNHVRKGAQRAENVPPCGGSVASVVNSRRVL